jgi:NAD(P)H-dependent flavin oxidoreductase YrpB (nitropropane dioxygenase family)
MGQPDAVARRCDHDNLFCHDHERTIEFMQDVKVPWIAFKVLAAGAIPAEEGIRYAFESGADFICLGMFDFQVEHDAELVRRCVAAARDRKRPWV